MTLGGTIVNTNDAWAVGYAGQEPSRGLLAWHWDGNKWNPVSLPTPTSGSDFVLNSVDVYSSNVVWAVGSYKGTDSKRHTLTEYYRYDINNNGWHVVPSPDGGLGNSELAHVWVNKEESVWADGYLTDYFGRKNTFILHWDGEAWDQIYGVNVGLASQLIGIAGSSSSNSAGNAVASVWAVGAYTSDYGSLEQTLIEHITAPGHSDRSTSYYEQTKDPIEYRNQGCKAAENGESGIIILDFAQPVNLGSAANPQYGAHTYISHVDLKISEITNLTEAFIMNYEDHTCNGGRRNAITVAPAINNDAALSDTEMAGHAQAWAAMTEELRTFVALHGYTNIAIGAGIDAEEGYNTFSLTETWAQNYLPNTHAHLYNFGSIDTYPCPATFPPPDPCSPGLAWTVDNYYKISSQSSSTANSYPLPQIYKPIHARWWYIVKRRAYENHQMLMDFRGSWCCGDAVNTTEDAWRILWLELNSDPKTGQNMPWTTANKQE